MSTANIHENTLLEIAPEAILAQLDVLTKDPVFSSSKRSVQFLRFVVEQTMKGSAASIKERTIGVEVFGRDLSYDTNQDHVVRTAAIELRKRLAIYYGDERHRHELRVSLVPGSYIPRFSIPEQDFETDTGVLDVPVADVPRSESLDPGRPEPIHPIQSVPPVQLAAAEPREGRSWKIFAFAVTLLVAAVYAVLKLHSSPMTSEDRFWQPLLAGSGSVLIAVGDVPAGPPTSRPPVSGQGDPLPVIQTSASSSVPFGDATTLARVTGVLVARGKQVSVRRGSTSSFSDLREGPLVLIGAFNNPWSLRLTQQMRYSLALDPDRHLIYIKDANDLGSRKMGWVTNEPVFHQGEAGGPPLTDYALISRIWNSETGHAVIVIGGLYIYGTEAGGELLASPELMTQIGHAADLADAHRNLQIVLATTVTDGTPGPPRLLAVWQAPS